jgi:Cu/Ag efflux protein CusF
VTIDHAPIPEANWPAMTMAFKPSPEVAKQAKVGDKVAFDLKLQNGAGEITAIKKQ